MKKRVLSPLLPLFPLVSIGAFSLGCRTLEGDEGPAVGAEPLDPRIEVVLAFRAAQGAGDEERMRSFCSADPRVWYDTKTGEGRPWRPWRPGSGRWHAWDTHFRGRAEPIGEWRAGPGFVACDMFEINDYFRLVERGGGYWCATYFLDEGGRITGFMVSSTPGREPAPGRREEFEAWAFEHEPAEAAYLMPGGALDPTGDRAPRMRALLNRWRAAVGLRELP